MNLATMKTTAILTIKKGALLAKKYSPEILTAVGIVTNIAGTVLAARATLHLEDILDSHAAKVNYIKEDQEISDAQKFKKELTKVYFHTVGSIAKLYAPTILVESVSIACSFGSHKILKDRNVALMAAYSSVATAYEQYRSRLIEEYGKEKDEEYITGVRHDEVVETVTGKNGKDKDIVKVVDSQDISKNASLYGRCFDELNDNFNKGRADLNLLFLRNIEQWANDRLILNGHLFLNEVYDALGFEHTQAGSVIGWVMGEGNQNHVDFGIYNLLDPSKRKFVNGDEAAVWLDFNVDGVIYNLI